jgi:hypothetical protein
LLENGVRFPSQSEKELIFASPLNKYSWTDCSCAEGMLLCAAKWRLYIEKTKIKKKDQHEIFLKI